MMQQPKEEFICNENINEIKVPKRMGGGRPGGFSSSSENNEDD